MRELVAEALTYQTQNPFFSFVVVHTRTLDKWSFLPSWMYVSEWKTNNNNNLHHCHIEFEHSRKERVERRKRRTMHPATWHVRLHQYVWLYTESLFLPIFFSTVCVSLPLTRLSACLCACLLCPSIRFLCITIFNVNMLASSMDRLGVCATKRLNNGQTHFYNAHTGIA